LHNINLFLFILVLTPSAWAVPLKDNILFGFEKCKSLSVDLEKGLLKEVPASSFDVHCKKKNETDFSCDFFETGSTKSIGLEVFSGGSELGVAELKDKHQRKLRFLIGKNFASYESGPEQKVCIGIYLFEQDALKKKSP
jgi:hypothetical protein